MNYEVLTADGCVWDVTGMIAPLESVTGYVHARQHNGRPHWKPWLVNTAAIVAYRPLVREAEQE